MPQNIQKKKVTVLLPVYNENIDYLKKAISSLLIQTCKTWKCYIIFEGNNKDNLNYINKILSKDDRFKLIIPSKKSGLASSLNIGLEHADTEYIARFDSDDIMHHERLHYQLMFLEKNKDISVVGSNLIIIDKKGKQIGKRNYPEYGKKLNFYFSYKCGLAHPSTMFRLKDVEAIGMYNSKLSKAEDLDLWLRMLRKGFKFYNIQKPLLLFRLKSNFRPRSHWEFVLKVRKANLGTFNLFQEKFIFLVYWIICKFTK